MRKIFTFRALLLSGALLILGAGCGGGSSTTTTAPAAPSAAPAAQQSSLKGDFSDGKLGYSIKYDDTWSYYNQDEFTMIFKGTKPSAKNNYVATVNIQPLKDKSNGGAYSSLVELVADLRKQLTEDGTGTATADQTYVQTLIDGTQINGVQFIAEYPYNGVDYKQWQIAIPNKSGNGFFMWGYTAPKDVYDADFGTAQEMLKTWTITK